MVSSQQSFCASVCPDLQLKAAELNQTLSRRDGAPDKSLKEMKEEIQAMLAEMRKRQLGGKKSIAEEEMEYGHTSTYTHTHSHTHTHSLNHTHRSRIFLPHTGKMQTLRKVIRQISLCLRHTFLSVHIHTHDERTTGVTFLKELSENMPRMAFGERKKLSISAILHCFSFHLLCFVSCVS